MKFSDNSFEFEERELGRVVSDVRGSKGVYTSLTGRRGGLSQVDYSRPRPKVEQGDYGVKPGDVWRGISGESSAKSVGFSGQDAMISYDTLESFLSYSRYRSGAQFSSDILGLLRGKMLDTEPLPKATLSRLAFMGLSVTGESAFVRGGGDFFDYETSVFVLRFIGAFRWVKSSHVATLLGVPVEVADMRLRSLESLGLLVSRSYHGDWFVLTDDGAVACGFQGSVVGFSSSGGFNPGTLAHYNGVVYVASCLMSGSVNVLGDSEFPRFNRVDYLTGSPCEGEIVVSEHSIQSSLGRMKYGVPKGEVGAVLRANRDEILSGSSSVHPATVAGQEWLWCLLPPRHVGGEYHVPDLVVYRPEVVEGSPESIAIEVERHNKSEESLRRIMASYREDTWLYKQVVWFCADKSSLSKLTRIRNEVGLDESRCRVVLFTGEHGVLRGIPTLML